MATATRPASAHAVYPVEALQKLFAPPETELPAEKLRRLLHEARARKTYLHTAGAYDAFTAAIMTCRRRGSGILLQRSTARSVRFSSVT